MEVTVTLPKYHYDELVEFKNDIDDNKIICIRHEYYGRDIYRDKHVYEYSAKDTIIEDIKKREDRDFKYLENYNILETEKFEGRIANLKIIISDLEENIKELKTKPKKRFWLF